MEENQKKESFRKKAELLLHHLKPAASAFALGIGASLAATLLRTLFTQIIRFTVDHALLGETEGLPAFFRLARADFPNRKQIVHEILHPEDRPAPQKRIYEINYSALEAAVRRIQQDVDFLMKYLPKVPDDAYVKVETTKILKQHKAYMAQFEELLNDKKIA